MVLTHNHGWNNLNGLRSYPLSERATRVGISGEPMPDDILEDMVIMASEADRFFVSSVRVTPAMASVVVVSEDRKKSFACSAPQPVQEGVAHPLSPLADGMTGWVVFGPGAARPCHHRFAGMGDGGVDDAARRLSEPPGVSSIERLGTPPSAMTGVVEVKAGAGVEVEADLLANAVVVRLSPAASEAIRGETCAGKLLEGECGAPMLRSINGARGVDGVITVVVA
jgi:hypothetical protein